MEFLVTDCRTLARTWIAASDVRAALIRHENTWRAKPLPANSNASDYSAGAIIDIELGESSCIGRREFVTRS